MRTEDGDLVNRCLNGEPEAFGVLVDAYKSSIYALVYARVRNFHDAEDITQEAFIKAYQNLRALKRGDNFRAWLYSIASNLCKNFLRSKSRRPDGEFIDDQGEGLAEPTVMEDAPADPMHDLLHEALAALPDMYREVLTLHYLGGMKSREIAQFLGTSKNTIDTRLSRAKSHLKEEMLAMMSATYEGHRLQPSFTFRIVELIKETKIHGIPNQTALPWGLSIATGLAVLLLSLASPYSPLYPIGGLIRSALPIQTQVAEKGVIPVDAVNVTKVTILSSDKGKKNFGQKPKPEMNAFAPPGQEGKWTKKADMPTARAQFSTAVVNGKIYPIGGFTGVPFNPIPTVEEYNPATDKWTKKADMPTARILLSTSVVNGKIYAIGGWNQVNLSTVEEYDPVKDTWTKKADMPTARSGLSTSVVNGKIYAIGGGVGGSASGIVEEYDPVKDTWTKKADMPTLRTWLSTSAVNGKIYAIGGVRGNDVFPTVEEYDPAADIWTKKADMPTARMALSTSVVNGIIYAIGGSTENVSFANNSGLGLSTVEGYDPITDTWMKKAGMPTARFGLSTNAENGKIYAFGGTLTYPKGTLLTVEEHDPGLPQSVTPAGKLPTLWGRLKAAR